MMPAPAPDQGLDLAAATDLPGAARSSSDSGMVMKPAMN